MRRQHGWFTAVTLFLLLVLAACGGATTEQEAQPETATDVEATGSESIGDVLPTPISGAKALPTRAGVAPLMPDILLVAPPDALTAVDLITVSTQLALPNAHFALTLYGAADPAGSFDFTADITAVSDTPDALNSPLTLSEALAAGLQLPGWRAGSAPRLIVLVVDETEPDEQMLALAATAVSQNMRLYILQTAESADWAEAAEVGNGRVLLLPDEQTPGALRGLIAALISEISAEMVP